jgi:PBSX family phage terminase large subunit
LGFRAVAKTYAKRRLATKQVAKVTQAKPSESAQDLAPRPLVFRGANLSIQDCEDPELLVEGPAGTGKTVAILQKLYRLMDQYPGCRILIVRKVKASLAQSILKTFERQILPEGHPERGRMKTRNRDSYMHVNGSEIVCGGLDDTEKLLSTEYDVIYVAEAIEVEEGAFETLANRLRNYVIPFQQIIADCNPDHPRHWLNRRAGKPGHPGMMRRFKSRHEDNPEYHDGTTWTEKGLTYIARLERSTGVRLKRFRYGEWAASQGVIYGEAVDETHWIPKTEIQIHYSWRRIWAIDFGYSNPFVWQEWAIDDDGTMYRVQELYFTHLLVEDAARMILEATSQSPPPEAVICDHDAEDRATFEKHTGHVTTAAHKAVLAGINAVKTRLKVQGNGKPRLFFIENALIHEPDPNLIEKKLPTSTDDEVPLYVWDEKAKAGDKPTKANDHGLDTTRYAVCYIDDVADDLAAGPDDVVSGAMSTW